jgi:hypothetical protein
MAAACMMARRTPYCLCFLSLGLETIFAVCLLIQIFINQGAENAS